MMTRCDRWDGWLTGLAFAVVLCLAEGRHSLSSQEPSSLLLPVQEVRALEDDALPDPSVRSGLQPGQRPVLFDSKPVFDIQNPTVNGNYVCRYAYEPMILLFARNLDAGLTKLLERLDAEVDKHRSARLRVVAVFLPAQAGTMEKELLQLVSKKKLTRVNLAIAPPGTLRSYQLAEEANLTVLFYRGVARHGIGNIVANHAFRTGELKDGILSRILADVAPLCLPIDPDAEREALAALRDLEPIVTRDQVMTGKPVVAIRFQPNRERKATDGDLAHLKKLPHLRSVELSSQKITDAGLRHLAGLTRLEELNLNWNRGVTAAEVVRLVKDRPKFRRLELGGLKFRDDDLKDLRGLKHLRGLSLRGTLVTDRGLPQLESFRELRELSLMSTGAGDEGLKHLKALIALENLDLDRTAVTDAGVKQLAALRNLRSLQMAHTAITDAGLEHLQTLLNLERLELRGTRVTKEGVDRLKQRLPKVQVGFGPAPR
jgi:hypothetical protein